MAQIFNIISIVAFAVAGVSLILAVVFWIKFDILQIINDLTGRTAKKSIDQMRQENEKMGRRNYNPVSMTSGKGTSGEIKIKSAENNNQAAAKPSVSQPAASNANVSRTVMPKMAAPSPVMEGMDATEMLQDGNEQTELLNSGNEQTELLDSGYEQTELLDDGLEQTMMLEDDADQTAILQQTHPSTDFEIIQSIIAVHTEEKII